MDRFSTSVTPPPSSGGVTASGLYSDLRILSGSTEPNIFRLIEMEPGVGQIFDRNGVEILGGGGGGGSPTDYIIWRPGGTPESGVIVAAAASAVNTVLADVENANVTTIYVDSSVAAAELDVPLQCSGRVRLVAFATTSDGFTSIPQARMIVTAASGGIANCPKMSGIQLNGDSVATSSPVIQMAGSAGLVNLSAEFENCSFFGLDLNQPAFRLSPTGATVQSRISFTQGTYVLFSPSTSAMLEISSVSSPPVDILVDSSCTIDAKSNQIVGVSTGTGVGVRIFVQPGPLVGFDNTPQALAPDALYGPDQSTLVRYANSSPALIPPSSLVGVQYASVGEALDYLRDAFGKAVGSFFNGTNTAVFAAVNDVARVAPSGTVTARQYVSSARAPRFTSGAPPGNELEFSTLAVSPLKIDVSLSAVTTAGGPGRFSIFVESSPQGSGVATPQQFIFDAGSAADYSNVSATFYITASAGVVYDVYVQAVSGTYPITLGFDAMTVSAEVLHLDSTIP